MDLLNALDASWDGMAFVDAIGRVTWWNRVLGSWLDSQKAPMPWESLLAPPDREAARNAHRRMLANGLDRFEARLDGPSKTRYLCTLTALGERGFRGVLLIVHDPRRAANGGAQEVARLRELNEARTRFVNTAAHEFSTPLTPLLLQTYLLKTGALGPLSDRQRDAVTTLERNMDRLSNLVRSVLDVARLGADRLIVQKKPMDLASVARHAYDSLEPSGRAKGLTLSYSGPERIDIEGDPDRLTQVFVNLIHNAIKFTPAGGEIDVRLLQHGQRLQAHVTDTGPGLRPEDIPRLFLPFSQGQAGLEAAMAGSGLGLSIAQGIIAQHGGRIWCESAGIGHGATFSFDLPLQAPAEATEPVGVAIAPGSADRRPAWTLFYFHCPQCGSRDIEVRLLRNRYDCSSCGYVWR